MVQLETSAGTYKKAKVEGQQSAMTPTPANDLPASASGEPTPDLKKRSEYKTKDLPVPSDQRWSRGVIGTLTLWCGTQPDIWVIPDEAFVKALQDIFNAVYPETKHRVVINGAVHAVVSVLSVKLSYSLACKSITGCATRIRVAKQLRIRSSCNADQLLC